MRENPVCGRRCIIGSSETHFLATISEADFPGFRSHIESFRAWPTYNDFMMERDGCFLGLSWAGVDVVQVETPLGAFERWIELTGSQFSLESLDDFAMRRWLRAQHPEWVVSALRLNSSTISADRVDRLYIPIYPTSLEGGRRLPQNSDEVSDAELARGIAADCLDNAG